MTDSAEHELQVPVDDEKFLPGNKVSIRISERDGMRAVLLSYLVPLVIIVATLGLVILSGYSEGLAALIALAALIPYFMGLKVFDRKSGNRISLEIIHDE